MGASEKSGIAAIVLAAGKGTRMKSDLPKVLHKIAHRPMILHLMDSLAPLEPEQIVTVMGPDMDSVAQAVHPYPTCIQYERLGTGHAVQTAQKELGTFDGDVLILYGDTPFISTATQQAMIAERRQGASIVVLGFTPETPGAYGRLQLDSDGYVEAIIEAADATPEQLALSLCNSGVMCVEAMLLFDLLSQVTNNNAKGEYYLTDIVALARKAGNKTAVVSASETELMGVNSRQELAKAEAVMQDMLRQRAMDHGASMVDPNSVFLSWDTQIGRDVVIGPNVVFGPEVTIGDHVDIRAFCHFEGSVVADGAVVGPYARLRPGANIGPHAHIGNFVEIKKSEIEAGAKVNHLSYIGDAQIGAASNIGAGTITCNYDGFRKHRTEIGSGAFIGSNSALVAPVQIGSRAIIGAGSVVTQDVADGALAVARGAQTELPGWAERFRSSKNTK